MKGLFFLTLALAAAVLALAEPEPQGSIVLQGQKPLSGPDRRPTFNIDYQHNIWEGKNGRVSAGGGAIKLPGQHVQPHVGIQGTWRFRRSADPEPQGSIVFEGRKPLDGPDRRATYNLDYKHKIYEGKDGYINAQGGAQQTQGGRVGPHVGVEAGWRFRRSADPEPQGSIVFEGRKPLDGPDRRATYNLDYKHKIYEGKNGYINAQGGAQQTQGGRVGPHVGVEAGWRFRRSADPEPQGSIVFEGRKPLDGPDRRATYNLDYKHKIYEGKDGYINAQGGAQQTQGGRVGPHVGVEAGWRFRRSADPEPQGSIVFEGRKPLDGPDRRATYNLDYKHKIYEGKNGYINAQGGAQQTQGGRVGPHVGVEAGWRFRRSADPEPQGSIHFEGRKPLDGPDRRATYNLGYQHKIYEGKNGYINAQGGAQQTQGGRVGPHVGVEAGWRFRRSADPEPQGSIVFEGRKPLDGPDRRATYNLDYKHKIYEGKNGYINAQGGAQQTQGGRVGPHVGVEAGWRFRRSADPEPQGSIVFEGRKPLDGPDRRATYNLDYKHKIYEGKNGYINAQGGAQQTQGGRVGPHVGVEAGWRFRRSADPEPQGSIHFEGRKPLDGPDRRATYNLGYQHKIYEGKNGYISAQGGAQQTQGGRIGPHVGVEAGWRFRRSADPEPQGSIVLQGQKPLSGPDRRPTFNLDYQHKIWEGRNGHVSAAGGALKLPGQHVQPHVGIQGTWRF